jgi:hypothetical protein
METMNGEEATLYVLPVQLLLLTSVFVACMKQPFEACCACAKDCSDVFGRFTTWPRDCGTAIMNCHTNCPAP